MSSNRRYGSSSERTRPQAGCVFLRDGTQPPTAKVVAFIDANRHDVVEGSQLGVESICTLLQVAPSGYYAAKARPPSARAASDAVLTPVLVALWEAS